MGECEQKDTVSGRVGTGNDAEGDDCEPPSPFAAWRCEMGECEQKHTVNGRVRTGDDTEGGWRAALALCCLAVYNGRVRTEGYRAWAGVNRQ